MTLRCLLLSPVSPIDPDNGDAQFTRDLLAAPPEDVEYITYTDALAAGMVTWGRSLRDVRIWRRPLADPLTAVARAGLHGLRRSGVLLPDPVRWLRVVAPFDVVHVHCFPVRFLGPRPPVVITDSAGTFWYWTAARGMRESRVLRMLRRERFAARAFGYIHPTARPEPAERVLFFVDAARALLQRTGVPVDGIQRCPPGVPHPVRTSQRSGKTLLFVARNFDIKGGGTAIEILRRVRARHPDARLMVAGPSSPDPGLDGVVWLGPRTRDELYTHVYPAADIFVYPTRFDCAPLVVMEALAHGLPVIAPDAFALPELVKHGQTGVIFDPDQAEEAAGAVVRLIEDDEWRRAMGDRARDDFAARFSVDQRNRILGEAYAAASSGTQT